MLIGNVEKICIVKDYPLKHHLTGFQRVYELNALLLLLFLKKIGARCRKSFKRKEGREAVYISMHTYSREFNSKVSEDSLIAFRTRLKILLHLKKIISALKLFTNSEQFVSIIVAAAVVVLSSSK